jgi:hypothetical protein
MFDHSFYLKYFIIIYFISKKLKYNLYFLYLNLRQTVKYNKKK